jgi:protein-histidine pros-kinase
MLRVVVVFALVWLSANLALHFMIVRPLTGIAHTADQLSRGEGADARFAQGGSRELAALGRAFDRMRTSLEKALRLLEK